MQYINIDIPTNVGLIILSTQKDKGYFHVKIFNPSWHIQINLMFCIKTNVQWIQPN